MHGIPCTCLHAVSARYKYVAWRREWGKVGLPQQLNKQNKNLLRQMNLQTPFIVGTESVMDVSYLLKKVIYMLRLPKILSCP